MLKTNRKKLETIVECKDKKNVVLKRKKYEENNPDPDSQPPYKLTTTVDRDGKVLSQGSNGTNFKDSVKFEKTKNNNKMKNKNDKGKTTQIDESKDSFIPIKFDEMFGKNFPFNNGDPFGEGFPFNKQKITSKKPKHHQKQKHYE